MSVTTEAPTYDCRQDFADELISLAEKDERIVAVCNDSVGSSNLVKFRERFPDRLINVGIAEQGAARLAAERLAEQEVAVAVHQVDARAAVAQAPQRRGDVVLEGRHGIVADPYFEKIAEDVQRLGLARPGVEKMQERPGNVRALLFKMQVGDQQDHSTISAFSLSGRA